MNNMACALSGVNDERVALVDVSVSAVLQDQLSEVTMSQTYRNIEAVNIEAVYTFTIPLDAVLLELEVEIGGRVLKGAVVEKTSAEEQYEDAIASGDAAVMLEMLEPGLYTMNVGNLLADEQAIITFSYANIYRWKGDQLRIFLPTTVAPRYGESSHLAHQEPESSLTVENLFSLEVKAIGSLCNAQFVCPSHQVTLKRSAEKVVISLQEAKAVMDRDFILNAKITNTERKFALCGTDGDGLAAVASFQPFFPGLQQPRPLNLAIVIDCSGSMGGDSMNQAKQALDGMLDALQPEDQVTLIAFGNSTKMLSQKLLRCNKSNLTKAKRFAQQLDADMGGTEIGEALARANGALNQCESADIFLVTDGEVWSWESVVEEATCAGHRIFTVGVGSAVSETFVRKLANATGGECELVSPREGMADKVIRHFERMRAPRAKRVTIQWPEYAADTTPATAGSVFEGDTIIASARFDRPSVSGKVVLEVETESGDVFLQDLQIEMTERSESEDHISTIARLAASERLKEVKSGTGLEMAMHYRLISPWTNWLVIAHRAEDEQAQDAPELRKVPQTLQAGWGSSGLDMFSVDLPMSSDQMDCFSDPMVGCPSAKYHLKFSRGRAESEPNLPPQIERLIRLINNEPGSLDPARALDVLTEVGLDDELGDLFHRADRLGLSIQAIAAVTLAEILKGPLRKQLSRKAKRATRQMQGYAKDVMQTLKEMLSLNQNLVAMTRTAIERGVMSSGHGQYLSELRERFEELSEMPDRIRDSVQSLKEQINV